MANCKHECCGAAEKVWFQIRLIAKELERVDFDDAYSTQKEVSISVVKKHSKVREDRIRASL
jgi:hypothetical protein